MMMMGVMWATAVWAAPAHVRVSWDKEDTAHTMAVTWTLIMKNAKPRTSHTT